MEGKATSPKRPRGPSAPTRPSVAEEYGHGERPRAVEGSSRSSLFGLFRRQSGKPQPKNGGSNNSIRGSSAGNASTGNGGGGGGGGQSLRSMGGETISAAFDNMSFNTSGTALESPQQARESGARVKRMLAAAHNYRQAIERMSEAASDFGNALYDCADTKGAAAGQTALPNHSVDEDLQAAGGLHLLIANHANLLASSLDSQIERPVKKEYDNYVKKLNAKETEFKFALRAKMSALRQADTQRGDSRKRGLDLLTYRSTLLDLTSQIDDINRLKFEFLSDIHVLSTELAESLHSALASTVTAEIEVFESIARKGWSGNGLDGLLAGCPDPFEPERTPAQSYSGLNTKVGTSHSDSGDGVNATNDNEDDDGDATFDDDLHNRVSESGSKSPNLFSIIPPVPILPAEPSHDDDDELAHAPISTPIGTPTDKPSEANESTDKSSDKSSDKLTESLDNLTTKSPDKPAEPNSPNSPNSPSEP